MVVQGWRLGVLFPLLVGDVGLFQERRVGLSLAMTRLRILEFRAQKIPGAQIAGEAGGGLAFDELPQKNI